MADLILENDSKHPLEGEQCFWTICRPKCPSLESVAKT